MKKFSLQATSLIGSLDAAFGGIFTQTSQTRLTTISKLKVDDRRDEIFAYKSFGGVGLTESRDAALRALLTCH